MGATFAEGAAYTLITTMMLAFDAHSQARSSNCLHPDIGLCLLVERFSYTYSLKLKI
jgi:hypothetical protein